MSAEKINLIVSMNPSSIAEMQDSLDQAFHSMAMFKALELARHHTRFQLLLPYNGGRSEAMLLLEQDTAGQAPDAGEPLAHEATKLSDELAAAVAAIRAKAEAGTITSEEAEADIAEMISDDEKMKADEAELRKEEASNDNILAAETEFLVGELAAEVIEFCEENGDDSDEGDDDVDTSDMSEEEQDAVAAKKDEAFSETVDAEEECTEMCRNILAGLTKGLLESTNMSKLSALANLDLSAIKEYTWMASKDGVVTFVLTK